MNNINNILNIKVWLFLIFPVFRASHLKGILQDMNLYNLIKMVQK